MGLGTKQCKSFLGGMRGAGLNYTVHHSWERGMGVFQFEAVHNEILSKYYLIKPKSECMYHAPIDLEPNRRSFGSKSIGAW